MVVLRDCHCCKTSSPDPRSAEGQLFGEETVQLSKPGRQLGTQILLHELSGPSICGALQFFLRPSFLVFNIFCRVPVPEEKKTRHHEKRGYLNYSIHTLSWAMEGCRPIHGKIAMAKFMPEQRHSRLSRIRPGDGAAIPKQISQCLNML